MMRLARRATLLVALLLLLSAATAYAECAWVLWGLLPPPQPQFTPVDAFHTKEACEADAKRRPFDARWFCLPDTVDPRGPRGSH